MLPCVRAGGARRGAAPVRGRRRIVHRLARSDNARLARRGRASSSTSVSLVSRRFGALSSLLLFAAAAAAPAHAQNAGLAAPTAHARVGFERIRLPGSEHVGLLGTSYLVDVPSVEGLALGPAVYGGITGHRGGFFTLGGEVAWRRHIAGPVGVEVGLYAGGGGGAGAPVGGGLMFRPHVDLLWDLGPAALGLSLSRVRFPSGRIDSTQVGIVLDAINDFRYVPAARLGSPVRGGGRSGLGFDRVQIVASAYRTRHGLALDDGTAAPRTIGMLGLRAEQAFDANAYWGVEANGTTQRSVAGYAEYLGVLGYETEAVSRTLNVGARIALGMGGGGGLPTGGGLLAKATVYGIVRISNELGVALEAGLVDAPKGRLRAAHAGAALVWSLDGPDNAGLPARPARTDFSAGLLRYRAPRRDGSVSALEADVLRVDRYLGAHLYLSGEVHSALRGGAGGYTAALVGLGWSQPLGSSLAVGAEVLGGASGGGGVDSRGSLVRPMGWLAWQLSPAVALRVGAGRVKSPHGPLSSTAVDAALVFTYGVAAGS